MLKVFSVYDSKSQAYIQPFYCVNSNVALRSFQTAARTADHDFFRYGEDFCLYELGLFDPETGEIVMHEKRVNLGLASQFSHLTVGV